MTFCSEEKVSIINSITNSNPSLETQDLVRDDPLPGEEELESKESKSGGSKLDSWIKIWNIKCYLNDSSYLIDDKYIQLDIFHRFTGLHVGEKCLAWKNFNDLNISSPVYSMEDGIFAMKKLLSQWFL